MVYGEWIHWFLDVAEGVENGAIRNLLLADLWRTGERGKAKIFKWNGLHRLARQSTVMHFSRGRQYTDPRHN